LTKQYWNVKFTLFHFDFSHWFWFIQSSKFQEVHFPFFFQLHATRVSLVFSSAGVLPILFSHPHPHFTPTWRSWTCRTLHKTYTWRDNNSRRERIAITQTKQAWTILLFHGKKKRSKQLVFFNINFFQHGIDLIFLFVVYY